MTAQILERGHRARPDTPRHNRPESNPSGRRDTTLPTRRYDEAERMPLRTDLFLVAHCDDTGRPHLDKHSIAVGLAGAVLLELWHAGRVRLGWHGNSSHGTWRRNPGQVTLLDATPTDDPIHDAALGLLWRLGGTVKTQRFMNEFATTDLYEAVRDQLVAQRILRATTRRRFWVFRTQTHRPILASHPVQARGRVRNVARLYKPHTRDVTFTALATALGLTPYLRIADHSVSGVFLRLAEFIGPQDPVNDITNVIAPHRLTFQ